MNKIIKKKFFPSKQSSVVYYVMKLLIKKSASSFKSICRVHSFQVQRVEIERERERETEGWSLESNELWCTLNVYHHPCAESALFYSLKATSNLLLQYTCVYYFIYNIYIYTSTLFSTPILYRYVTRAYRCYI